MEKQRNIPLLRFPEFKQEWENKILGEVCEKIQDGNYGGEYPKVDEFIKKGIPFITSKALGQNGTILENKIDYISPEKHKQLKKAHLKLNDILFTNRGSNVGTIGLVNDKIAHGNIGPQITLLRCKQEVYYLYLKEIMASSIIQKQVLSQNSGSAMNFFGIAETSKFKIPLPPFPEQKKIAIFLTELDNKIQLLHRKKKLYIQYKNGCMQQIFSQAIRFKDNKGNTYPSWKKKRLGDVFSFFPTNSYSRSLLNYDSGCVKNIHYGDIHTKFKAHFDLLYEKAPYINSEVDTSKIKKENYCKEGDLIIADASEDYKDIGKAIEIINLNNQKLVAGLHTYIARDLKNYFTIGFKAYMMQTHNVRIQMMKLATGISVLGITKGNLAKVEIKFPIKEEQQKIANFLSAIDSKINHVNIQLQKMQQYKKGLLQQMFI